MARPDSYLERKIRSMTDCNSLERGDTFRIESVLPSHDGTERGEAHAIQFSFRVFGAYGHAKIINGRLSEFSCDRNLSDKQIDYVKAWLFAYYLWAYPNYR